MIWMRSRFAADRVLERGDEEGRRLASGRVTQVAAHRHALGVADSRGHAIVGVRRLEVPAAEEAHDHARAGGGVGFPALHGVQDRLARVFLGPHGGVTGGADLPVHDLHAALRVVHEGGGHAVRAGLGGRGLAEEIVLLDGGEAGVRVGAADQAELVGIRRRASPSSLRPFLSAERAYSNSSISVLLRLADVEVALVPASRSWRTRRWARGTDAPRRRPSSAWPRRAAPTCARSSAYSRSICLAERLDDREHRAVAQVAVVRDGEHAAAGLLLVGVHPFPQVDGIGAAQRRRSMVNGSTWLALSPLSRKMTLRCRLLPLLSEVHS